MNDYNVIRIPLFPAGNSDKKCTLHRPCCHSSSSC